MMVSSRWNIYITLNSSGMYQLPGERKYCVLNSYNAERNSYVKEHITAAMLELLKEKELKKITVDEIADRSGTGRVSFYRNYGSKEDIIVQYVHSLLSDWYHEDEQKFAHEKETTGRDDGMYKSFFTHLTDHANLYQLFYQRGLLYLLKNELMKLFGPKESYTNFPAYVSAFAAGGLYSWVEEWMKRGMPESAEEIFQFLKMREVTTYDIKF